MKRINSISNTSLQLLLGLLVGLFVLTQTVAIPGDASDEDRQEQSESDTQSSNDQDQANLSEAVPSTGSQIYLGFQSILLQEVTTGSEKEDRGIALEKIVPATHKALKILFRRIISPNAP